jgi:hypothetical protein
VLGVKVVEIRGFQLEEVGRVVVVVVVLRVCVGVAGVEWLIEEEQDKVDPIQFRLEGDAAMVDPSPCQNHLGGNDYPTPCSPLLHHIGSLFSEPRLEGA